MSAQPGWQPRPRARAASVFAASALLCLASWPGSGQAEPERGGLDAVASVRSGSASDAVHLSGGTSGGIRAFTAEWTRGARSTSRSLARTSRVGTLSLTTRDGTIAEFVVRAGAVNDGRRAFLIRPGDGLRLTLSGTTRPRLSLRGLPTGIADIDLVLNGAGTRLVERSARCRNGLRTVVAAFRVHQGNTSNTLIDRSGTVACGSDP